MYFSTKFVFTSRLDTVYLAGNYLCVTLSFHAVCASNDCCTEWSHIQWKLFCAMYRYN